MAKRKENPEATPTMSKVEESKEVSAVAKDKKEADQKSAPKPDPKPVAVAIPFARWFSARGFKSHWKSGMRAFADTSGRKTMDQWDKVFKNY